MILVFIFGFLCGSSSEQRNIVQLCTKRTGSTKTDILFLTPLTGNDNDINNMMMKVQGMTMQIMVVVMMMMMMAVLHLVLPPFLG